MNSIRNYVENMFSGYPKDENNLNLKEEIIQSMEDKFDHYKSMGSSNEESLGRVFSEFGSILELDDELTKHKEIKVEPEIKETPEYKENLEEYNTFMKKYPFIVAISVLLFIVAAATFVYIEERTSDSIAIIIFFIFISIGVVLLIISGMRKDNYERVLGLKRECESNKRSKKSDLISSFVWMSAVAIFLIIGLVYEKWQFAWIVFIVATAIDPLLQILLEKKE